jgi:hypothetical protein
VLSTCSLVTTSFISFAFECLLGAVANHVTCLWALHRTTRRLSWVDKSYAHSLEAENVGKHAPGCSYSTHLRAPLRHREPRACDESSLCIHSFIARESASDGGLSAHGSHPRNLQGGRLGGHHDPEVRSPPCRLENAPIEDACTR